MTISDADTTNMKAADWQHAMNWVEAQARPAEMTLTIGNRSFTVSVASTPDEWTTGMASQSHRDGMLFMFPTDATYPFHMRNIDQHLIIAFYDAAGRPIDIAVMVAQSGFKWPSSPYRYVVEVPLPEDAEEASRLICDLNKGIDPP